LPRQLHRPKAVGRLAHDLDIGLLLKQTRKALAHDRVVIGHRDADLAAYLLEGAGGGALPSADAKGPGRLSQNSSCSQNSISSTMQIH